ncbi:hypothetical protein PCANC_23366 [Puccinia coronata f. sp. avenae]|uniref:Uncharacterized protein n=1 Tax=Puccinia coronata f. sp. avenae TaxID=200324 RepID=A0A2N5SG20_9BASI|nr:hypothetical protein PCANC_23366 [Puccinia coronata f. sp. avenae]
MTNRSNPDNLLPPSDPEAIIRAANAAKRQEKAAATAMGSQPPSGSTPTLKDPFPPGGGNAPTPLSLED